MKIARIRIDHGEKDVRYARPLGGKVREMELLDGDPYQGVHPTGQIVTEFTLLAPIVPAAILCIGLNYRKHAEEMKARIPQWPVLFFKNPSALQHPGEPILIPRKLASTQVDFEGELAIIIGRACRNTTRENALSHVLGYTVANDVSARDWQKDRGGSQWCRGKSFDTFCPLGPWICLLYTSPSPRD